MHVFDNLYEAFCREKIRKYTVYVDFYKKTDSGWEYTTTVSSGTSDILWGKSIISLKIVKGLTSGTFDVGKCLNSELTLKLYTGALRLEANQKWKIVVKVSFTGIWTADAEQQVRESGKAELGTFYTESETVNSYTHTFKATSAISETEKYYVPVESEYPKDAQDIMRNICNEVEASSEFVNNILTVTRPTIMEPPYKSVNEETGEKEYYTMREILGFFAAIQGGSAYIDGKNCLRVTTPTAVSEEIPQDSMISIKDNNRKSVYSLVYIPQEYEAGTPEAIAAAEKVDPKSPNYKENILVVDFPLKSATEYSVMRSRLENAINGMTYESCVVKKQGTGKYELGDFLKCTNPRTETYYGNIMVMGIVYEISANNGFTETLYSLSKAKSDGTSLVQKVDKAEKKAEESEKKSSGGAISSYIIEAENKVTANGISYTIEKGADGVINKISDSLGNLLLPTLNATVTDVQTHNAVMWATAVARGITGEAPGEYMPYMDGVHNFFTPETLDTGTGHWRSTGVWEGAETYFAPNEAQYIATNQKSWRCVASTKKNPLKYQPNIGNESYYTVYALVKVENLKTSDIGDTPNLASIVSSANIYNENGACWGFTNQGQIIFRSGKYYTGKKYWGAYGTSQQYFGDYVCVAYAISEDTALAYPYSGSIFINGKKQEDEILTGAPQSSKKLHLNYLENYGANAQYSFADCNFKFVATAAVRHTDQQIAENCQWIMKKYQLDWKD